MSDLDHALAQVRRARAALDEFEHLLSVYKVAARANLTDAESWAITGPLARAKRELASVDGTRPAPVVRVAGKFTRMETKP